MDEEVLGKAYDGRLMRRLLGYLRPYWAAVALALSAMLALSGLQVVGPLLSKAAVDWYLVPVARPPAPWNAWLSSDPHIGLAQIALLYLLVIAAGLALGFAEAYLMQWTGQRAMFDLRRELMEHLHRADIAFFDRHPVGRLVTRVTTDVDALNELLASGLVTIVGDLLALSLVLLAMVQLSPGLTLAMLAVLPLIVGVTLLFRRQATASYRRIRAAIARINAFLQEHIHGMTVVQLFNREARSMEEFRRINRDHMLAYKDAITAYGWFYPAVEFLAVLSLALMLAYGGYRVQSGGLTLGVLVAFFQYSMRFFRPIQDLSEKYNLLQAAMAAAERIFALLDTRPGILAPVAPRPVPGGPVPIEFDGVWFAYKDEDWVLRDVSFRIEPGQTVAVVGHTGAGKTTLVSLLLRFYDVQRGSIRIGGVDIREFDPRELRRQFGVVLQDPHLFSGTIGDNIRLGTEWITEDELVRAAEQVNLLEYINSLPAGFAQPLRERGDGLSTGQKQLVSFARALAHNPRFLILDEATSSVDTETELRVREAIARLTEGRTAIIIAHRLSTIQRADLILVLHKGRLRETGTHQQLLSQRGIYWRLYQLQYKDQETRQPEAPSRA
ncbi:MAG: ABC transporter ATP-binding protein [Bryobacterales bacterium]|nr:ABC transporter ATP-binding protein/permease [Bryobacteraceae bacterium]MDW8128968.1 ABC transporter ATP-binding protein [Bryobacterales bacterium]